MAEEDEAAMVHWSGHMVAAAFVLSSAIAATGGGKWSFFFTLCGCVISAVWGAAVAEDRCHARR